MNLAMRTNRAPNVLHAFYVANASLGVTEIGPNVGLVHDYRMNVVTMKLGKRVDLKEVTSSCWNRDFVCHISTILALVTNSWL